MRGVTGDSLSLSLFYLYPYWQIFARDWAAVCRLFPAPQKDAFFLGEPVRRAGRKGFRSLTSADI